MRDNEQLLKTYDDIIKDQLSKGVIEKIDEDNPDNHQLKHYIPHHAVTTPGNSTTKARIVYDASAKSKKGHQSLNGCMLVILEDLSSLLLRFRTNEIAMVADIEKAFLQIALQESERDVTRFLWLKDLTKPVSDDNVQTYRFSRVPFGIVSSPFLLGGSIQHHLKETGTQIALKISKELYVDNLISGERTPAKAIKLYQHSKQMFQDISMNLREWASNSKEVMETIPVEDRTKGDAMKVLGMKWKPLEDIISIRFKNRVHTAPTKRQILKETAEVFDPLGLFTPITLQSKILLRELWKGEKEWDEPISEKQEQMWTGISKDLNDLHTVKLPRFVGNENCKLYCFSDASGQAYATTVYLSTEIEGKTQVNLVFSKSRIAPTKPTSIPRLELLGVLIGVRSLKFVRENLQLPVAKMIHWTDSQCVLNWIKSTKPLPSFVENRLKEIKTNKHIEYRYVNTKFNPADLASRGKKMEELRNDNLWWHGPSWLSDAEDTWPNWDVEIIDQESLSNLAKLDKGSTILYEISNVAGDGPTDINNDHNKNDFNSPYSIDINKYSSLNKLIRTTAWITRFIGNIRSKNKKAGNLTAEEITHAKMMWIRHIQKEAMVKLKKKKSAKKENKLNLQIDDDRILRCHGRLTTTDEEKINNPIYLPKKNQFTRLVIKDYHELLFHAGTSHTLSIIRMTYWIPHGRTEVRSVLVKCGVCLKYHGGPFKMPKMSNWPASKTTKSTPFTYTGLDYMGPLYVKDSELKKKVWICLFTCVTIRAVHLEVIDDMSAEQFLMALRRFLSRRGTPTEIICDNATQFKATKTATDKAWNYVIKDDSVYDYASTKGIKWKFIGEFSPWTGGFYERLIGMVKSSLRKSIGPLCLTKTQLSTFITEAEGILNSRPLVYIDEDINSSNAITPNHFLSPLSKVGTPVLDGNNDDIDDAQDEDFIPRKETTAESLLKFWKRGQSHIDRMWRVWYSHYILSLRERYQTRIKESNKTSKCEPRVGEIVHLKDDLPRGRWKMGKIEELIESTDGEVRAAKVRMPNRSLLKRPLNLLYPMELAEIKIAGDNNNTNEENQKTNQYQHLDMNQTTKPARPKREAAKNAKTKIQLQADDEL